MVEKVYVFHGEDARFCASVFSSIRKAEAWIELHQLTGILTAYQLDKSAYDWAIEEEFFKPKKEHHKQSKFIGGFTSAHQEHYHYEKGKST